MIIINWLVLGALASCCAACFPLYICMAGCWLYCYLVPWAINYRYHNTRSNPVDSPERERSCGGDRDNTATYVSMYEHIIIPMYGGYDDSYRRVGIA